VSEARAMSLNATGTAEYLLVDDEVDFVTTLAERLEMRELDSVAVVHDGEAALSYVAAHKPRVVVLDLRMPGRGGMEVLREIKTRHPEIEVIIFTGHGTERDEMKALELGAFAYMQKPVDIERLARTMQEACARAGGQR
jgi:DNA-binding NtrC family response regulator